MSTRNATPSQLYGMITDTGKPFNTRAEALKQLQQQAKTDLTAAEKLRNVSLETIQTLAPEEEKIPAGHFKGQQPSCTKRAPR